MTSILDAARIVVPAKRYADFPQIVDALRAFMDAIDAETYLVANVPMPGHDLRNHVIAARLPEIWSGRYLRDGLWRTDPIYLGARGARVALREAELPELGPDTGADASVLAEAHANGVRNRYAVPCLRPAKYHCIVQMSFPATRTEDDYYLIAGLVRRLVDHMFDTVPEALARPGQLTPRERQIVALTAEGFTSNEIAEKLGISARTVFAHLTSAGDKLHAANKTETVVNSLRHGQISL
jgi:DNA-binding CsgD family transcriptional regulator